jgi:hypothetical protein
LINQEMSLATLLSFRPMTPSEHPLSTAFAFNAVRSPIVASTERIGRVQA